VYGRGPCVVIALIQLVYIHSYLSKKARGLVCNDADQQIVTTKSHHHENRFLAFTSDIQHSELYQRAPIWISDWPSNSSKTGAELISRNQPHLNTSYCSSCSRQGRLKDLVVNPSLTPSFELFRDQILFNLNVSLKAGFIDIGQVDIHLIVHLKPITPKVHIDATL
jgi:hypothetical protein